MRNLLAVMSLLGGVIGFEAQTPQTVHIAQPEWVRVDRHVPGAQPPRPLWSGEPLVHPRGVMLDDAGENLYVTDPGEPVRDPVGKPARIVRFPMVGGHPDRPSIFFVRPGFMISAKWGFPTVIDGKEQVLVADQGEGLDEYTFSGVGAKVFTVPVLPDGSAGEPEVLWAGKPFVCPTGIARAGRVIYVTDPCAGEVRTRDDVPGVEFPSSAIFALKAGVPGPPILLKSGAPFTSLIGVCILTPGEIIVNDTDSGRLDPTGTGGRRGFAPPAGADRWVMKILDEENPALSDPVRTTFLEEGPVTLEIPDDVLGRLLRTRSQLRVSSDGHSKLAPWRAGSAPGLVANPPRYVDSVTVDPRRVGVDGTVTVNVASDFTEASVRLNVTVGSDPEPVVVEVPKSKSQVLRILDNKHGGAKGFGGGGGGFGGGGAGGSYLRFTTDNAPGHGAVMIYRDDGGPFAVLAEGPPFERPVSAQLSVDAAELFVVDQQTGTLFTLAFPSEEVFAELFP